MQIIVLGMHRAALPPTRLINMMGAYLGPNNLLMPASSDNPKVIGNVSTFSSSTSLS
ncbi:MAG: hypothetical protein IPM75_10415 [Candidatus Competibacteraceae bacterium]|nr:hypothetical protein [Candidatus Competibacteraceae bacterium]